MDHKQKQYSSASKNYNKDQSSQQSVVASEAYTRSQRRTVKNLYDSCYIKPEDNKRVIQDKNPVKVATLNEAL